MEENKTLRSPQCQRSAEENGTSELWYTVPYHLLKPSNTRNVSMVCLCRYTRKKNRSNAAALCVKAESRVVQADKQTPWNVASNTRGSGIGDKRDPGSTGAGKRRNPYGEGRGGEGLPVFHRISVWKYLPGVTCWHLSTIFWYRRIDRIQPRHRDRTQQERTSYRRVPRFPFFCVFLMELAP